MDPCIFSGAEEGRAGKQSDRNRDMHPSRETRAAQPPVTACSTLCGILPRTRTFSNSLFVEWLTNDKPDAVLQGDATYRRS